MAVPEKKCMICGKAAAPLKGGICDPCQERIRGEALGRQSAERSDAERELRKHGVTPESGKKE